MTRMIFAALLLALSLPLSAFAADWPTQSGDFIARDVTFKSGETLAEVRMRYTTLGTPHRNAQGEIDNAVMVLHGTGGSGRNFLVPIFADELYGPGQPLDLATTYVILPDNIGHGGSSKPSDGLRMAFPRYDYDDMVALQHRLLVEGLGVKRLKLILGTSMGCMHAFVWGETYPGFAERLAPFACNAVPLAGRNRMWRKMAIDAIRADPAWMNGNYKTQPLAGLRTLTDLLILAGANPVAQQAQYPTREATEKALDQAFNARIGAIDANDALYYINASRNYDPSPTLEKITVPVLWVNSADDFINPPELGLAEQLVKRMPKARFVLIPASTETRGHGTHTAAKFWKADLAKLLAQ
ncbi:MAG: hypothetical protein B7Z12_05915 [Caulobacter vibrioides]|uniref:AB hydrolase-1 domain-containing protein n=1 Tax=Caulobacter vibrioides TaxID=155892 RepID=A0A258DAJ0_CAUVI|nr:MAG: hypothetical protein B7Z12_05915 [Caulobacter vibrioides]